MKKSIQSKLLPYFIYAIVSFFFITVYSFATSPLTKFYGADSAFFIMVGRGIKEGLLPYRDFYDMKGPYLFFIEYIGQLFANGRTGAFIIQIINLTACLCIVDSIYSVDLNLFCKNNFKDFLKLFFIGIVPFLIVAAFTFEGGNLTEEFSLVFLLLSVKFLLKYFKQCEEDNNFVHPLKYGFFYGLFLGILALIRITNAVLIGAVVLTISVMLICHKKIKNLMANGLMLILGVCVAFAPMVVFFLQKGILTEMLSQVFLFGFTYSSSVPFLQKILNTFGEHYSVIILMFFPILSLLFLKTKDWKYWLFAIVSFVFLMIATCLGNSYLHYFTLGLPNIVFGISLLLRQKDFSNILLKQKRAFVAICIILVVLQMPNFITASGSALYRCIGYEKDTTTYNLTKDIKSYIPEEDYDSIYVYGLSSCCAWYETTQTFPSNRYCDWQDHYMELVPEIKEELLNWLSKSGPNWLIVSNEKEIKGKEIKQILDTQYSVHTQNDKYILLKKTPIDLQ